MQSNTLDELLEDFYKAGNDVSITLRDNTVVQGRVNNFDGYIILLTGEPEQLIYRHSILKVTAAIPASQPREAREPRPRRQAAQPQPGRQPRPRPERQPAREPKAREEKAKPEHIGTMGEEMLKWLKSQKGNE